MAINRKIILGLALTLMALAAQAEDISYSVTRIWGDGSTHCAFTSLVAFNGRYYCSFREGYSHIFNAEGEADGRIRIISSADGRRWHSVAVLSEAGRDLRDPKLSITPDGRLMVNYVRAIYKDKQLKSRTSLVSFSLDGSKFSSPTAIKEKGGGQKPYEWLWRLTWHEGTGYGVSYYQKGDRNGLRLLSTTDGTTYREVKDFDLLGGPNETTVRFAADDTMLVFIRRESRDRGTMLLTAAPPYTDFIEHNLGFFCGGPDAIVLADGSIALCGRSTYIPRRPKTVLYTGDSSGIFEERLVLPSGGDCSYPSFLKVGDELWMTYYSSHETSRPSIYLARIPLSLLRKQ